MPHAQQHGAKLSLSANVWQSVAAAHARVGERSLSIAIIVTGDAQRKFGRFDVFGREGGALMKVTQKVLGPHIVQRMYGQPMQQYGPQPHMAGYTQTPSAQIGFSASFTL